MQPSLSSHILFNCFQGRVLCILQPSACALPAIAKHNLQHIFPSKSAYPYFNMQTRTREYLHERKTALTFYAPDARFSFFAHFTNFSLV